MPADLSIIVNSRFTINPCFTVNSGTVINPSFTIDPSIIADQSCTANHSFTVDPSIIPDLSILADASNIVNPSIIKDKRVFNHSLTAHPSITGNLRSTVKRSTTVNPSIAKNFSFEINVGSGGNIGGVGNPATTIGVLVGWHRAASVLKVVGSGHFLSQPLALVWFIRASFLYGLRLSRC